MSSKLLIVVGLAVVSGVGIAAAVNFLNTPRSCVQMLKDRAEKNEKHMVLPNQDGGLFLMLEAGPSVVDFLGYAGPKTVALMEERMVEAGLLNVTVKNDGTCQADNGLEYTVVKGRYTVPEQKPDPI
jgi:hypothetical protein